MDFDEFRNNMLQVIKTEIKIGGFESTTKTHALSNLYQAKGQAFTLYLGGFISNILYEEITSQIEYLLREVNKK